MEKTVGTQHFRSLAAVLLCFCALLSAQPADGAVKVNVADGFDFPVGKPDAAGYYKARGLRLRSPRHFGEDWNGRGGGDSDLGDPVYSCADGVVTFAHDVRQGWGNVVLIRHAYRDPTSGQVKLFAQRAQRVLRVQQFAVLQGGGEVHHGLVF